MKKTVGAAALIMRLRAFAKINLDLRILGRREDGFHEVRTILQTIDWADELQISSCDKFEFAAHGMAADSENLVVRAVRAFEKSTGQTVKARIELYKNVPAGAGLGGGSADAAVTVLGLQRLVGKQLPEAQLHELLASLGSDVPFFAIGGRALATGRGDHVQPMEDEEDYALVVVAPPVFISTKDAYSWLTGSDKSNNISRFCAPSASFSEGDGPGNDFESAVFARHPLLQKIRDELLRLGARRAALSGSGSAIFGIFGSRDQAACALPGLSPLGIVKLARPLSRPEYLRSLWGVAKR